MSDISIEFDFEDGYPQRRRGMPPDWEDRRRPPDLDEERRRRGLPPDWEEEERRHQMSSGLDERRRREMASPTISETTPPMSGQEPVQPPPQESVQPSPQGTAQSAGVAPGNTAVSSGENNEEQNPYGDIIHKTIFDNNVNLVLILVDLLLIAGLFLVVRTGAPKLFIIGLCAAFIYEFLTMNPLKRRRK